MTSDLSNVRRLTEKIAELEKEKKPIKIVVRKREEDYIAFVGHSPACWDCGPTLYSAIGNLVASYPDLFNVQVEIETEEKANED